MGWVSSADVRLEPVSASVWVDLSARRIRIRVDGRPEVGSRVAVGSAEDPTPTGLFFVTDRVRPLDPHGAYGGFALGLSAHSDTLSEFRGADGQVGIHGTNDQGSIGLAVSHGCVRVPASVEGALARVPLGTPVLIIAG
jgi:lipoprotein-anchoring transpeptidase ErfK/SrfK